MKRVLMALLLFAHAGMALAQATADQVQWDVPRDPPNQDNGQVLTSPPAGMDPASIEYMQGEAMSCKNVLNGSYKCCRENVPDQEPVWWKTYKDATRQYNARKVACGAQQGQGGWSKYKAGADYKTLQERTTGEQENLDGGGATVECGNDGTVEDMQMAFMEQENSDVRPGLNWYCDEQEFKLAVRRTVGQCSYVGTRCVSDVLGYCLAEEEVYCCFNSPVSREIRESQLRPGETFGTADDPQCGGIPAGSLTRLRLDEVDVDSVSAHMKRGKFLDSPTDDHLEEKLTGNESAMGDPLRKTVTERTTERMAQVRYSDEQTAVENSQRIVLPTSDMDAPVGPGHVSFTAAEVTTRCDRWFAVDVTRDGGQGAVSVTLSSVADMQGGASFDAFDPITLTWPSGDVTPRTARIRIRNPDYDSFFVLNLTDPTGGADAAPTPSMTVLVHCNG